MSRPFLFRLMFVAALLLLSCPAQYALGNSTEPIASEPSAATLPDSPGAVASSSRVDLTSADINSPAVDGQAVASAAPGLKPAGRYTKLIAPGQAAPPQTAGDKFILGVREAFSPFSMVAWVSSAGWSQLIDSAPHYGTNGEAFAQRLGAAAANGVSKEIFSDSIFAPVFHQDPRYYKLGKGHKFINRAIYAGTRPIIGRTDSGKDIPNYAMILGSGAAAGIAQTYYPERDRNVTTVMTSWATNIGGSSLGYLFSEFGGEIIQMLKLSKPQK